MGRTLLDRTLLDRLGRFLWPLAVANLLANIGIVEIGRASCRERV